MAIQGELKFVVGQKDTGKLRSGFITRVLKASRQWMFGRRVEA